VLPLSDGGLHCGDHASWGATEDTTVLPPFSGGLHCGNDKLTVKDRHV
jgi:hypothetical protein